MFTVVWKYCYYITKAFGRYQGDCEKRLSMPSAIHDSLEVSRRTDVALTAVAWAFIFAHWDFHVVILLWRYATEFSGGSAYARIGSINNYVRGLRKVKVSSCRICVRHYAMFFSKVAGDFIPLPDFILVAEVSGFVDSQLLNFTLHNRRCRLLINLGFRQKRRCLSNPPL